MYFLSIHNKTKYILLLALALSLVSCTITQTSGPVEVLIDAPERGLPFVVFDALGQKIIEGKTPAEITLNRRVRIQVPITGYGLISYEHVAHSSEYTIIYTTPDGKRHGHAIRVIKTGRVMLNKRR